MIAQAIADGILTGAIIALGAIGVTFTLGIMRFANFAHSELLTWGAYIALVFVAFAGPGAPTGPLSFGWQLIAAAVVAAVLTGLAAWAVDVLVFRRLAAPGRAAAHDGLRRVRRRARHAPPRRARLGARVALLHARAADGGRGAAGRAHAARPDLHRRPGPGRHGRRCTRSSPGAGPAWRCGRWRRARRSPRCAASRSRRWSGSRGSSRGALAAFAGVFTGLTPQLHPEIGFNLLLVPVRGGDPRRHRQPRRGRGRRLRGGPRREPVAARDQPGLQGRHAVPAAAARSCSCARRASSATASVNAVLPGLLRVRRAGPRRAHARAEPAVGLHRSCSTRGSRGSTRSAPTPTRSSPRRRRPQYVGNFGLPWPWGCWPRWPRRRSRAG